jgi:hypothetical protein
MGGSSDKDEYQEPNIECGQARNAGAVHAEQRPATPEVRALSMLRERRKRLQAQDDLDRTPLFYAAEQGLTEDVWEILFRFRGTGMGPPRLALITTEDHSGLTAADVAEQNGHQKVAHLLRKEQVRMEYYE